MKKMVIGFSAGSFQSLHSCIDRRIPRSFISLLLIPQINYPNCLIFWDMLKLYLCGRAVICSPVLIWPETSTYATTLCGIWQERGGETQTAWLRTWVWITHLHCIHPNQLCSGLNCSVFFIVVCLTTTTKHNTVQKPWVTCNFFIFN